MVGLLAQLWQKTAAGAAETLAHEVEKTLDADNLKAVADDLGDLDLL